MHGIVLPSTRASAPNTTSSRKASGVNSTFEAAEKEKKIERMRKRRRRKNNNRTRMKNSLFEKQTADRTMQN